MWDSDPIAERRKGWTPRPAGGVKLVSAWQPPEQVGAGQDEIDAGPVATMAPPVRDDWRTPTAPPAPSPVANPEPVEYPSQTARSTPLPAPFKPAVASPSPDVSGVVGAPTPRVPGSRPAGGADGGYSPYDHVFKMHAGDLADNDEFISIVAAGTKAESNWDTNSTTGDGGHSWGLFQMHDQGAGAGWGHARLDPYTASAVMVPRYAEGYRIFKKQGYSGAQLAARVAQYAERSADPTGAAYANAYNQIVGGGAGTHVMRESPLPATRTTPQGDSVNPAEIWATLQGGSQDEAAHPSTVWQSLQGTTEVNPADVWSKLGVGAGQDEIDPGSASQGDDPWANRLLDPATDIAVPQPTSAPYAPVTPWERHAAETQVGTSSDELTRPKINESPTTPAIKPEPQQEPQPTIFDVPILKDPANAVKPIQMAQPDTGRHVTPYQPSDQAGAYDFGLPPEQDPNKDLTPIARSTAGAPVNPLEMHQQLQDVATQAVVPQQIRDAPLVGGLVEQALDPAWMAGGTGIAGTELALQAGGKLIKAIGGNVIAHAPVAVRLADASMGYIAKTGADAILRGLDRIQPGLGQEAAKQLPAHASAQFAAALGGGGVSAGATAIMTPEDDPNRMAKIIGAAAVGAGGTLAAIHVYPAALKVFNDILADAKNTPPHVQAMFAQLAHAQEAGRVSGDMIEQRILDVMADRKFGFPKRGSGMDTWQVASEFERTKGFAPNMTPAQQALADDMWHYGEITRNEGKRLGVIKGDVTSRPGVEAYFPHLYEDHWKQAQATSTKRGLNPHDFFTDFRTHDTLLDGFAAGQTPVGSMSEAWGAYVRRYESSKAKRQFAIALRTQGGPEAILRVGKSNVSLPEGWVSGKQFSIPGLEQFAVAPDVAKALRNLENPSILRDAPIVGGVMNALADIKQTLFAPSAFHLAHELHQSINASGLNGVPVFAKSLYYNMNPWAYRKFMLTNADRYVAAANAGVTMMRHHPEAPDIGMFGVKNPVGAAGVRAGFSGGTSGTGAYLQSKAAGDDDRTALERGLSVGAAGAALGVAGGPISRGLWERSVPTMKLLTWETTRTRYGDKAAAEYVNEVFGGQNLEAIARSKTVQDMLRLAFLAPDWQEGWVRQVGNGIRGLAATPYAGQAGKQASPLLQANADYWTNAALTGAFMLEGLNYAFNGHFSNENSDGHQLTLELTGLYDRMGWPHKDEKGRPYRAYMDILGPYRGLLNAPFDPGKFAQARLGLGPSTLEEIFSGKDFTGRDIVPPGEDALKNAGLRFAHAVSRLAPVSGTSIAQTFGKEPLPVAVTSTITGYRTSRISPIAEQLRARDKEIQKVTNGALSPERIHQANETYTNKLGQADRQFQATINRKNLTHQQIDAELAKIQHPNRASEMAAAMPTNLAGDPAQETALRETLQRFANFGTGSSQYPADIQPESMVDLNTVTSRYWTPRPDVDGMPKAQADSLRQKELAQMSTEYDVEVNTLMDAIKAQSRGIEAKPVPGVSSAAIDEWVKQWSDKTSDDPLEQSAMRRDVIDSIAKQNHLDSNTVWNRIKLRYVPPNKPGELEQSRDKALDMLFSAHDPNTFPKYLDNTGKPMGGKDQWQSFDAQIAGAKTAHDKAKPEIKALITARDAATANQRKYILNNPDYQEYQRWFGVGRGMNEAQWNKYVKGDYPHYKDTKDPQETLNRDKIAEQYKASTPGERRTQMVRITIEGKPETLSLEAARRHIQFELQSGWSKALGLDTTGTPDASSGG